MAPLLSGVLIFLQILSDNSPFSKRGIAMGMLFSPNSPSKKDLGDSGISPRSSTVGAFVVGGRGLSVVLLSI